MSQVDWLLALVDRLRTVSEAANRLLSVRVAGCLCCNPEACADCPRCPKCEVEASLKALYAV